jgi:hypothetical protein
MAKHYVKNILKVFEQVTPNELQHGLTWYSKGALQDGQSMADCL